MMQMPIDEIVTCYRQAKDQKRQLQILAERNLCTKAEIADILTEAGEKVDRRACREVPPRPAGRKEEPKQPSGYAIELTKPERLALLEGLAEEAAELGQAAPGLRRGSQGDIMNAVFKYSGAKWFLAKWIISHFPKHHSYLEPFLGSGAVLFTKSRSKIETVNDLDSDVVNLFDWIRTDPERLANAIYWTPYAREVYERAWSEQYTETDTFQRAVNFYIRMMMGHGFRTTGEKVGWKNDVQGREKAYAADQWCKTPDRIFCAAERLRMVQIENRPAVELIERFNFPNVLIYADPPYLLGTRHGKQYRCEMTDADHRDLLDVLKAHRGPVLLSGYDSKLYNDALEDWYKDDAISYTQTATKRKEILWMNFEPDRQLTLDYEH